MFILLSFLLFVLSLSFVWCEWALILRTDGDTALVFSKRRLSPLKGETVSLFVIQEKPPGTFKFKSVNIYDQWYYCFHFQDSGSSQCYYRLHTKLREGMFSQASVYLQGG